MEEKANVLNQRVRRVLVEKFENNKTRMSAATGHDRSTIAKYESGARRPTKRFMIALSQGTGINLKWLLGEGGDAIEYGESDDLGTESSRPVTKIPCEGIPTKSTPGFNGLLRQTAAYHSERNRYWLVANKNFTKPHVEVGDHLLIRVEVQPRAAKASDEGSLFVLRRGDDVVLDVVAARDVRTGLVLYGKAILVERDLE
jgi:transcriptional regulator with XRE-family HTH domain